MMSLAKQVYDYYFRPYLGEKGQDMVEYALMLAIIVGIGWLRFTNRPVWQTALIMYSLMRTALWKLLTASLLVLLHNSLGKVQRASAKAGVLWKDGQWCIGRFSKECI